MVIAPRESFMALFFRNSKQGILIRNILFALFVIPGALITLTNKESPCPATVEHLYYHDRIVNELFLASPPAVRINPEQNTPLAHTTFICHQTRTFNKPYQFLALQAYNSLVLHQIKVNEISCLCLRSCVTFLQLKNIWHKCADDYPST
jgi:hypothetical protein